MAETPASPRPVARRRFAPVPIETTVESYRQGRKNDTSVAARGNDHGSHHNIGPAGQLTPSPSPRSSSPPPPASPSPAALRLWTKQQAAREWKWMPRKEKRHFAPQLIDFSRRSRRAGDVGPATKPTDKTDITPHQNHIYAPKHRKKHRMVQSLARRESCDDETAAHVFEMLAREAEARMLEDAALAAYPNSHSRAGGAEHFVVREGSEDDSYGSSRAATPGTASATAAAASSSSPAVHASRDVSRRRPTLRTTRRSRRDSSTEDVGWALRELQEHHEQLAKVRAAESSMAPETSSSVPTPGTPHALADKAMDGAADPADPAPATSKMADGPMRSSSASAAPRSAHSVGDRISTLDLDRMSIEGPPNDALWTTKAERHLTEDLASGRAASENFMPFIPEEPAAADLHGIPAYMLKLRDTEHRTGGREDSGSDDRSAAGALSDAEADAGRGKAGLAAAEAAAAAAVAGTPGLATGGETGGFRGRNAYAGYRNRDIFASEREVNRLRKKSPPMQGAELVFRQCASPQQTKLETDFVWLADDVSVAVSAAASVRAQSVERNRDPTGHQGLWHGYCFTNEKDRAVVPIVRPTLLATPFPQGTQADPFAAAFGMGEAAAAAPPPAVSVGLWSPAPAAPAPAWKKKRASMAGAAAAAAEAAAGPANGLHPLQRAVSVSSHQPAPVLTVSVAAAASQTDEAAAAAAAAAAAMTTKTAVWAATALEAKITAEFTDRFVTQVFNYLSLGYPAMARDYDEELSKISGIALADLQRDDDAVEGSAKGHISLGDELFGEEGGENGEDGKDGVSGSRRPAAAARTHNHASCARWQALKLYIFEWARQHPDLDSSGPLAWGVQERRGSWGV